MAITKKGKSWEIKHSLWILWSFSFFLNGIGLIKAGNKTRVKKWRNAGIFYLVAIWSLMITVDGIQDMAKNIRDIGTLVLYIVCIIHSFVIKKEYLIRLELLVDKKALPDKVDELRNKVAREYEINTDSLNGNINDNKQKSMNDYSKKQTSVDNMMNKNPTSQILLDINTCSQEDLLQLPGVGIIEAKKVINYRMNKEIDSIEEFIEILNLKPHYADRIRPMLIYNKVKNNEENDIKINMENNQSSHMGRMVDF